MASTTVRPVQQNPQQVHLFPAWKDDIMNVKKLYLNRKYRPCAVLCDELLLEARHPLHRTFLYFYQAICYESLGQFAHIYSTNKIPLLEQAKDSFWLALQALPLPFITTEDGEYLSPGLSPGCPTLDILPHYRSPVVNPTTPQPASVPSRRLRSTTISSIYSTESSSSDEHATPRFDDYLPRQPFGTNPVTPTPKPTTHLQPPEAPTSTEKRLSKSLSQNHILAGDLVPSPLFSRKVSSKNPSSTTDPRPLPRLPIDHAAGLQTVGHRQPWPRQRQRKTALSTLISKFEGAMPTSSEISPLTARFERISQAFAPHAEEPSSANRTPTHAAELSSHHLTRYNGSLRSFRAQLDKHIDAVGAKIHHAALAQRDHAAAKPARLASFWSFNPADLPVERGRRENGTNRRELIENLRREGWLVNKEKYGWKGQAYYDDLRRAADLELV